MKKSHAEIYVAAAVKPDPSRSGLGRGNSYNAILESRDDTTDRE